MSPIKVLLVDDEVMIKRLLRDKVNWAQFDMEIIGVVSSAREALMFINNYEVDLIVTDMKMPLMDGNRLIEEALGSNKNLRFIVLSAYTEFGMVRKSFKLGVYDYLQKSEINTPTMNNVLMKLRNEIIYSRQERSQTAGDSEITVDFDESSINPDSLYTVLNVVFMDGTFPNASLEFFQQRDNQFFQCHVIRISSTAVMLLIEHQQHSMLQIHYAMQGLLVDTERFFRHASEYLIGVSSTGTGSAVEYLKTEAEKAIADSYYAPPAKTV